MSRIYTNVTSIAAQNSLQSSNSDLNTRLSRLSSGLRIQSGSDDPAGLIASESLRSEMAGITQAISNSERANSVISTAEGALNEVSALLLDLKTLINNSANEGGLAPAEIEANQASIDSAIDSIDRIANSTAFEGVKLLNGSMDFVTSGVDNDAISDLQIDEVRFGTASNVDVTIETNTLAEKATVFFDNNATGTGDGNINSAATIEVTGNQGVEVFSFTSGTAMSAMVAAINQATDVTGVVAIASTNIDGATSGIIFQSVGYGSKQFVSVETRSGTFDTVAGGDTVAASTSATRDSGVDAEVSVNGVQAVASGLEIEIGGPTVAFTAKLDPTAMNVVGNSTTFKVTGGGAKFQLGQEVNAQQQSIIGIQSIASHRLGNNAEGYLSDIIGSGSKSIIGGNYQDADEIVEAAIAQVSDMRGRLGAFQTNTLETTMNSLNVALENVTASESAIRDADFAAETAAMTRAQILVQAGTSVLSIANSQPQNVLALLG